MPTSIEHSRFIGTLDLWSGLRIWPAPVLITPILACLPRGFEGVGPGEPGWGRIFDLAESLDEQSIIGQTPAPAIRGPFQDGRDYGHGYSADDYKV